ncbi:MAG: hypothetical protein SFV54_12955 [Bryobacteraceae bacterium]|nr:hypothetical protein [Bryobacteraceae bacterium]
MDVAAGIASDAGVACVEAGHQAAAGRRADGAAGVGLGEAHAFGGHAVEVRGLNVSLAVAADVSPGEVIGEDEDDIRLGAGLCRERSGGYG